MNETFTLSEIVDLERPATHINAMGAIDSQYDGINFWCQGDGHACLYEQKRALPRDGWRHREAYACASCRSRRTAPAAAA